MCYVKKGYQNFKTPLLLAAINYCGAADARRGWGVRRAGSWALGTPGHSEEEGRGGGAERGTTQAAWAARGGVAARAPWRERNSQPQGALGVRAARRTATLRSQRRGRSPRSPAHLAAAVAAARMAEGSCKGWGARAGAEGAARGSGG